MVSEYHRLVVYQTIRIFASFSILVGSPPSIVDLILLVRESIFISSHSGSHLETGTCVVTKTGIRRKAKSSVRRSTHWLSSLPLPCLVGSYSVKNTGYSVVSTGLTTLIHLLLKPISNFMWVACQLFWGTALYRLWKLEFSNYRVRHRAALVCVDNQWSHNNIIIMYSIYFMAHGSCLIWFRYFLSIARFRHSFRR
jgi:hypothetical protein